MHVLDHLQRDVELGSVGGTYPNFVLNTSSISSSDPVNNSSSVDENALQGAAICPSRQRKRLTMASLNVNSLITKIDEIRLLVKNEKIDILAINETKIDHKIDDRLVSLGDFCLCRYDRSKQGGGVALYVRNTVRFEPREDLPNKSLELICIEVEPPNSNPFVVIAWHRPPSEPNSCFDSLHENLSLLDGEGKEIIILGDTNCDFCHRDTTPSHIVQLCEQYELFDMKQIIKETHSELFCCMF